MKATQLSSVTKSSSAEVYRVRANGEWATIVVSAWTSPPTNTAIEPYQCGEIMIHSSYGSWAHAWGNLGEPFKDWLADPKLEMGYMANKLLGSEASVFDGEKSIRYLRESLIEHRRCGDLKKSDARTIWDWIDRNESELTSSERDFVETLYRCENECFWDEIDQGARDFLSEPYERPKRSIDPAFFGFWKTIMPVFQSALREELAAQSEDRAHAHDEDHGNGSSGDRNADASVVREGFRSA